MTTKQLFETILNAVDLARKEIPGAPVWVWVEPKDRQDLEWYLYPAHPEELDRRLANVTFLPR